jgi:hypothetical protein
MLLVDDAEALFLVDYHQTEFLESNVFLKQAMGADADIDAAS